jgi:hypothetical protein
MRFHLVASFLSGCCYGLMASHSMNIAPGQSRLSSFGFTKQKSNEPLAYGLVSASEHAAQLHFDIQQVSNAQGRELEARRAAAVAAAGVKNPVGRPLSRRVPYPRANGRTTAGRLTRARKRRMINKTACEHACML